MTTPCRICGSTFKQPGFPNSPYCGKTHKQRWKQLHPSHLHQNTATQKCAFLACKAPVFKGHQFCSRTHAKLYSAISRVCSLKGCSKTVAFEQKQGLITQIFKHCCRTHARQDSAKPHPHQTHAKQHPHHVSGFSQTVKAPRSLFAFPLHQSIRLSQPPRGNSSQRFQAHFDKSSPILFYNKGQKYEEFSNFHVGKPIYCDGQSWKTSEHYFQAQKFNQPNNPKAMAIYRQIRNAPSARATFKIARANSPLVRPDWSQVKFSVMERIVKAKFTQDPGLRKLLLSTGTKFIAEHTTNDFCWGDGGNGTGTNWLGDVLMRVRTEMHQRLC